MNNRDFRRELIKRRKVLVRQYATLRRCAAKLIKRGTVRFDSERHTYIVRVGDYRRGSFRDLMAAKKLIELQMQIKGQAMRLLELEDVINK